MTSPNAGKLRRKTVHMTSSL